MKNISKETMNKYNNIEWNMMKGLRNRIVNDYECHGEPKLNKNKLLFLC